MLQATTLHHHYSRLVGMQSLDSLLVLLVVVDSMFFRKSPNSMLKVKTDLLVLKKEEQSLNPASVLFSIDGNVKIFFVFQEVGGGFTRVGGEAFTEVTPRHTGRGKGFLSTVILLLESRCPRLDLEQSSDSLVEQEKQHGRPSYKRGLLRFAGTSPNIPTWTRNWYCFSTNQVFPSTSGIQPQSHFRWGQVHHLWKWCRIRSRLYEGSGTVRIQWCNGSPRVIKHPPQIPTLFEVSVETLEKRTNAHQRYWFTLRIRFCDRSQNCFTELSGLFKVQRYWCGSKNQGIYWFWYIRPQHQDRWSRCCWKASLYQCSRKNNCQSTRRDSSILLQWCRSCKRTQVSHRKGSYFWIYRSSRIQSSCTRFYGTLQSSGFWRRIQKQNLLWNRKSIWIYRWSRSNCCYRKCTGSLFKLTGTVRVLFERTPFIGSGSLFSFTGATETTAVAPPVATLFEFNGNGAESRTRPYQGSGTLVTFKSATIARRVPYDATQGLFKLAGALKESFVPSTYVGTTGVQFIGASADRRIEFEAQNQHKYTSFKVDKYFYRIPL